MTLADLPLLLAGPIVRRCQPDEVWLWLATKKKPDSVVPTVYEHSFLRQRGTLPGELHEVPTREIILARQQTDDLRIARVGLNLFAILLRIRPRAGAFKSRFLRYDLELTFEGTKHTLDSLIAADDVENAYVGVNYIVKGFRRPFFRLPDIEAPIVQGSCRRPDARGKDAFIGLDDWMEKNLEELPQALFLTGDQIYADWVARELFAAVRELAPLVFGADEPVPYNGRDQPVSKFAWKQRKDIVNHTMSGNDWGFTTQDDGHLIGFSEFAAMYLIVWNPIVCWRARVDRGKDKNLEDFTVAVAAARRVMAHLPTYMVFDDHEITDDWYFNNRWKKANLKEPFTRTIMANGLAAYWAFQAWGNHPGSFSESFRTTVEAHLVETAETGRIEKDVLGKYQDALLSFEQWSFFAPTKPPALFIDTRTQREMSSGNTAVLIGKAGQKQIRKKAAEARIRTRPDVLLLILAGPLLAWNPAAVGQQIGQFAGPVFPVRYGATPEMLKSEWEEFWNNPDGIMNVVDAVNAIAPRACVVFSGDVHFSYCVDARFSWFAGADSPYDLLTIAAQDRGRFIQITSSPMKNINSNFDDYLSTGNIGERMIPKSIDDLWEWRDGYYAVAGEALPLTSGSSAAERTSLPDNNVCLVTFRGMSVRAHFIALGLYSGTAAGHFGRSFRL